MRKLAIHVAVGASLLTVAAAMAPVAAQTPERVPVGTTTTVRTDCVGGHGTFVVKQTRLDPDTTRVVVAGHDVHNGRWAGGFSPKASSTDGGVDIDVTAVDHEFRTAFKVDDVTADTNTTLVQGFKRACAIGETLRPKATSITSATAGFVVRHVDGKVTTAGLVTGCTNGSRWRYAVSVGFESFGWGDGAVGLVCRKHMVRIPKLTDTQPEDHGPVTELSLVARGGGDVVQIKYRVSTPAR